MAKLMKSFIGSIGGMASRLSGSDLYDAELDKESRVRESPLESKLSLSGSEEEAHGGGGIASSGSCGDDELEVFEATKLRGSLQKWTNYLHGWQERFFVLEDGVLSYYKSEMDTQYGCRGSISLLKVKVLVSFELVRAWGNFFVHTSWIQLSGIVETIVDIVSSRACP